MKKLSIILLLILFKFSIGYSQGFDWQYSSRLPFNYPYLFAGLTGSIDLLQHSSSLDLSEGRGECCNFSSGNGIGSSIGLNVEYWIDGLWSVNTKLSYLTQRGSFSAEGYSMPFSVFDVNGRVIGHDTASFINEMNSTFNYFTIDIGAKNRLFGTHFHLGASIELGYQLSNIITQTERVINPSYFRYNDGSSSRNLGAFEMSETSKFILVPKLSVGYDIPLGLGVYASPNFRVGFPIQNIAEKGSWSIWNFSFGLSFMKSIAYR